MPAKRSLPSHPDLEQQRTLARELLRAFRAGDAEARDRIRAQLPDKLRITLADAQFALAREYGFSSWADLRKHIEAARQAAGAGAGGVPAELAERLRVVLRANDAPGLRELLQAHGQLRALLNEPLFDYDSPALVHVAGREDAGLVDVLLSFGADPNRRSSWWAGAFHPLHVASDAAAERLLRGGAIPDACAAAHIDRPDLLDRLLAEDPGRVHERGGDGQTPLHFARSQAVADLLLAHGADIDARDVDHRATPAQWMLDRWRGAGRFELARYLVQRGAQTDIFLAAALGLTERVRTMLTADPSLLDLRTNHGPYGEQPPSSFHIYTWTIGGDLSPMQVAAQFAQRDTLEVMRALAEPRQRLLAALDAGDTPAARALLAAHPGMLDTLSNADRQVLPAAGWAANAAAIALMLELGFDPGITSEGGATALHNAAHRGAADCVRVVLRHPAATALLDLRDTTYGATPLGWCVHGSGNGPRGDHATVARLLLDAGASPAVNLTDASAEVRAVVEERQGKP